MRFVGLLTLLGWIASTPIHAFTASLDAFGGIVADTAYTQPSAVVSDLVDAGTGTDGFNFVNREASATLHSERSVDVTQGGGTRVTDSRHSLSSSSRDQEIKSEDRLEFRSAHEFHSTLEFDHSVITYGKFFFISQAGSATSLDLTRKLRFIADSPIHISLSLRGQSSTGGLNDMLSGLYVIGGGFSFSDIVYYFSEAEETIRFEGTGAGIDLQVTGRNLDDSIQLDFLIEPSDPGTSPEIELRWFIRQKSEIGPHLILRTQSESWETSASFEEAAIIRKVPEPSLVLLCFTALPMLWRRSGAR